MQQACRPLCRLERRESAMPWQTAKATILNASVWNEMKKEKGKRKNESRGLSPRR